MPGTNNGGDLVAPQQIIALPTPLAVTLQATRLPLQESRSIRLAYIPLSHHPPHEPHISPTAIPPAPSPPHILGAIAVVVAIQTPKDLGHLKMPSPPLHQYRL